jgi:thymidylate synthase (FAD)
VWGYTAVTPELVDFIGSSDEEGEYLSEADYLGTAAGKICYTTKPNWRNPDTNTVDKYIKNILSLQHYSVLAHASVTLYLEGVSRALTHELVRSRFLAFSQLSQRYCNSSEMDWVCPPIDLDDKEAQLDYAQHFDSCLTAYDQHTERLMKKLASMDPHMRRKRAREAARGVLPNITETKIVTSGNLRAWRDFLSQRLDPTADLEIMRLGSVILEIMKDYAPSTFSDFKREDDN